MARRRKAKKQDENRWMISYADLLTLLLALFIVLYSQSSTDVSRLKQIEAGMITAFHGNPNVIKNQHSGSNGILKHHRSPTPSPIPVPNPSPPRRFMMNRHLRQRIVKLNQAEKSLRQVLAPLISNHKVKLSRQPLSLRIRLNAKILYPSGQAQLTPHAKKLLTKISGVLTKLPKDFPITIQGYTNKKPIHTAKFPSNWKLSVMRAVSVVHLFRHHGIDGKQLSAQGFSKYHPVDKANTSRALRVNRRVAILIHAPHMQKAEPHVSLKQAKKMVPGHKKSQPASNGASNVSVQEALLMAPTDVRRLIRAGPKSSRHNGAGTNGTRSKKPLISGHGGHHNHSRAHGGTTRSTNRSHQVLLMGHQAMEPIQDLVSRSHYKLHLTPTQAMHMLPGTGIAVTHRVHVHRSRGNGPRTVIIRKLPGGTRVILRSARSGSSQSG